MSTLYPANYDTLINPGSSDYEDTISHAGQHTNINDAVTAVEVLLGTTQGSAVLRDFQSGDRAVSLSGTETLTNKTLGSATQVNLGTSGTGDLYYSAGTTGSLTRLTIGSAGQVLTSNGTLPSWGSGASDGWFLSSDSFTVGSVDTQMAYLRVSGSVASSYWAGQKVKFTENGTQRYGILNLDPTYGSPNTTFAIHTGTYSSVGTAATIGSVSFSTSRSPKSFPLDPLAWTVSTTNTSDLAQGTPTVSTWYNPGTLSLDVPPGFWNIGYKVTLDFQKTSTTTIDAGVTLSTTNASESDRDFTAFYNIITASGDLRHLTTPSIQKPVSLATKTTHYLNVSTNQTGMVALDFRGDLTRSIIRAINAYL